MNRVYIKTYGCQMNERDSEAVAAMLRAKGYSIVDGEQDADVILLNTCSVRDQAEQKAIGKAGHVTSRKKKNPNLIVGIMGCMAQNRGDELVDRLPDLDLVIVESGGDNLAATFSPELSDLTIYVIDVSAGDKIPRKGGPGITRSDLLVINKIDLAPHVGASLEVMERDTKRMRGERPFVMTNLRSGEGLDAVVAFIRRDGMLPRS